jgi:hypothetical protein
MKASHKEHTLIVGNQEVTLKPGQFVFGRCAAAKELGMTERQIRTRIVFLKSAGNLTIKTTNKFSIITIVNWVAYQGQEIENDQQNDQQATSKRPQTRMVRRERKNIICAFCIYDFYCQTMGKNPNQYKLTAAKKNKIQSRLKDCSVREIHDAILACKASPHHMGENEQQRPYNDLLKNIIPNREKVEWWNERKPVSTGSKYLT